jgi:hypothetical protein
MKAKWISINTKMPVLNEIIYYKGNLFGQQARYIGGNKVRLHDDREDLFDEWKPKVQDQATFSILHIDGVTKIEATGEVNDGLFIAEYTYNGMCYGATIPLGRIK